MSASSPEAPAHERPSGAPTWAAWAAPLAFAAFAGCLAWSVIVAQPARPPPLVSRAAVRAMIGSIAMVDLPGRRFRMGEPPPVHDILEGAPQHDVTLKPFRIGRYDVTFAQYDTFARATGRPSPDDEGWGRGDRPAINLTWRDVEDFIDWLDRQSGRRFRLPSEAEWEYADRAGTAGNFWWGDRMSPAYANTQIGGGRDVWPHTSPVGSFPASPWGLYDMQGNVAQRVQDCYHHSYVGAPADGRAWVDGPVCDARVVRGGSWFTLERASHAAARAAAGEDFASMALGFRLAEDAPGR